MTLDRERLKDDLTYWDEALRRAFHAGFNSALATYRDMDMDQTAKGEQYLDSLEPDV